MNSVCKTVFTVLNRSTTRKILWVCHKIYKFARGEYQCTLPHMRTSCPHDKMGSGVVVSTLVEHKVTGVITW